MTLTYKFRGDTIQPVTVTLPVLKMRKAIYRMRLKTKNKKQKETCLGPKEIRNLIQIYLT